MAYPKGRPQSEESKRQCSEAMSRVPRSKEWYQNISQAKRGIPQSPEHRAALSEAQTRRFSDPAQREHLSQMLRGCAAPPGAGYFNWAGGKQGVEYARLLCPLGYVREHHVQWEATLGAQHILDFALLEEKINIEIDGPWHDDTNDEVRDQRLRQLGWKVIRIKEP